jgi:hypothetical protein
MKSDTDSENLLDDILGEAAPAEFRAALLNQTLHLARCRRRVLVVQKGAMALVLLGLGTWLWNSAVIRPRSPQGNRVAQQQRTHQPSVGSVRSQPFDAASIIETRAGTTPIVASIAATSSIAIVETRPSEHFFNEINDQQLLSLFAGRSAALLRAGPDDAKLLILDEERRFPVQ